MKSRWLSTFALIGYVLIGLGITGLIFGHRFIFDPGQLSDGHEAWYYLAVGILMLINGLATPLAAPEKKRSDNSSAPKAGLREPIITTAAENRVGE